MTPELPEVWLRGPVDGYAPLVMPIVHALLQVREDIDRLVQRVPAEHVWVRPGGAASLGFHIRHTGAALDRLLTYARGDVLSPEQRAALRVEEEPGNPAPSLKQLADETNAAIDRAFEQLRSTQPESLFDERRVGRAGLPANVLGLLFHAAEHSTRHIGQAITTARILAAR
jgi:hypothetical protein